MIKPYTLLLAALLLLLPIFGFAQGGADDETTQDALIEGIEVVVEDGLKIAKIPPFVMEGKILVGIQHGLDLNGNYVMFDADQPLGDSRLDEYHFPVLESGAVAEDIKSLRDYLGMGEMPILKSFMFKEDEGGTIVREMLDANIKEQLEDVRIEALQLEFAAVMPPTADPNNYDPLAFAEWQYFYEQVELWERYISDELFGESLWAQTTFEPRVAKDEFLELMASHQDQANQLALADAELVRDVMNRIQYRQVEREKYRAWLSSRQSEIDSMADNFRKRLEGNLLDISGQMFMVTSEAQEKYPAYTIPVVTKVLTPHDLLNADGTVRRYRLSNNRSKFDR